MKKIITAVLFLSAGALIFAAGKKTEKTAASLIEDITTFQAFTDEEVPQSDIEKIVNAGINAQSAINMQPWHFTVVTDKELLKEIGGKMKMPKMPPEGVDASKAPPKAPAGAKAGLGSSPLAIIVSAKDNSDLDAGLATQLMTVEAVLLGYGTKIISSPTIVLNGEEKAHYQKVLGIPSDMSARAVILIGKYNENEFDAVSSATERKNASDIVTYIK